MSKEEAIEILSEMRSEYNLFGDEEEATRYHVLSWAIRAMNAEPVRHGVDAVEVVRCKDCIYYGDHGDGEMACAMMILYPNKPTDYCSLGERKEDDT